MNETLNSVVQLIVSNTNDVIKKIEKGHCYLFAFFDFPKSLKIMQSQKINAAKII